ncbi:MAG: DUF2591 family protein [FCB group bacterium]|jgi:hypothetical protein|nr:DUF2591 family protein [FCB group bacterium]
MKIKTSELEGAALDWAVAKAAGRTIRRDPMGFYDRSYWIWEDVPSGRGGILIDKSVYMKIGSVGEQGYSPSTKWAQGGPIIERENIYLCGKQWPGGSWIGVINCPKGGIPIASKRGDTPLVAAMRCYVASKLGDEVEIPEELLK